MEANDRPLPAYPDPGGYKPADGHPGWIPTLGLKAMLVFMFVAGVIVGCSGAGLLFLQMQPPRPPGD